MCPPDPTDPTAFQPWMNQSGNIVHPQAPAGAGGAGHFRSPGSTNHVHDFTTGIPHPHSPASRTHNSTELHQFKTKEQAIREVNHQMISPTDCFVTYVGTKQGWAPIEGTGCAHYVAHKLNIKNGSRGNSACDLGFVLRVPMLIQGMAPIEAKDVKVNDVWVNHELKHCGIVIQVDAASASSKTKLPKITISQCSSNVAEGRLGVNTQDWETFFHAHGSFHRLAASNSGRSGPNGAGAGGAS